MFDGTKGENTGLNYTIASKEDNKPDHVMLFPIRVL